MAVVGGCAPLLAAGRGEGRDTLRRSAVWSRVVEEAERRRRRSSVWTGLVADGWVANGWKAVRTSTEYLLGNVRWMDGLAVVWYSVAGRRTGRLG